MAKQGSLRDFQAYLAGRLNDAAHKATAPSWLGVDIHGEAWLVDLADGGEIVQTPQVRSVPLTRPWFAGLANVRGNLVAVTDFAALLGHPPGALTPASRLLLIGTRHGSNAALLVPRLLGLKRPEDFTPAEPFADQPAWGRNCLTDAQGARWHKLDVRALLTDPLFLTIGV